MTYNNPIIEDRAWLIQTLNQNKIAVDVSDLASSNKKNVIRVLHVDDDASILEISKQILLDLNSSFDIDQACCVDDAFKKLAVGNYGVVISDYEMPQKDGLQFLKELRGKNNEIPFVLLTGKGREEVAIKALNLGADAYINKIGNPETVYGELSDALVKTIERKTAKRLHAESESKYRKPVENSLLGIAIIQSSPTRSVFANSAMGKIFGYTPEEMGNLSLEEISKTIQPDDQETLFNRLRKLLDGKEVESTCEFRGIRKDGSIIWVELSSTPIEYNGQLAVQGVFLDITKRKKAEEVLMESEANYRNLINGMDESVWVIDFDGNFLEVNNAAVAILGYSREELQSLGIKGIDNYLKAEQVKNLMSRVISGDTPIFETVHTTKDGKDIPVEISASLITYQGKQRILAIARNITDRKKKGEELNQSNQRIADILESIADNIYALDVDWNFIYVNKQTANDLGYEPKDLKGKNYWQTLPRFVGTIVEKNFHKAMSERKARRFEWKNIYTDGFKEFTVYPSAEGITVYGKDITERKKAEEMVKRSEERYRDLANFLPVIVFETDLTGKITFFSTRAFELTGVTPEDVEKGSNIISFVLPQERERAIENMKKSMAGNKNSANEYTLVRKNGTTYPALVKTTPIISENRVIGVRGLVIDITERKKAEMDLKESRDKLELMNEKLRVVGSLSRHDVRNKLSAVNGYTYLLKKKHEDQADIIEGLDKIEQQVKDSAKIFEFAKMYEQLGIEELSQVDVGNAVDEAVALFSGLKIKVVNDCQGRSVLADSFLRQMFYNFIDNTKKYGEKATIVRVYCDTSESDKLRLIYEDDGVGISAENKLKLFKEGFSTGGSTGFGLFFIKKMMDVYGWTITEEGEPRKGAKFMITIPINHS